MNIMSFESEESLTLGKIKELIDRMLERGMSPDSEVRVRTRFSSNTHGSLVKRITAIGNESE